MQQLAFPQASENVETPSEIVAQRWRRGTSNLDDFSYVILGSIASGRINRLGLEDQLST